MRVLLTLSLAFVITACGTESKPPPLDASAPGDASATNDASMQHDASAQDASAQNDASTHMEPDAALDAAVLECRDALPLRCGDRLSHDTTVQGQESAWSGYACSARAESGRETVYSFRADELCQVSVRMAAAEVDLDLFALAGCDPFRDECLDQSPTPVDIQSIEAIGFDAEPASDYVVAVDGYGQEEGPYELAVDCLCGEPGASLGDGEWELRADREWQGDLASVTPETELDEADYVPIDDDGELITYAVRIVGELHGVTIEDEPAIGEPVIGAANTLAYALTEGTTAGGRFLIWIDATGSLQAELTIFGSGVPIAYSERGQLVRKP